MVTSNAQSEDQRINVTKTFLPSIDSYASILQRAWDNVWLTNRGELILELEEKLKEILGMDNILIMNNGTIPIQIALKLLGNHGEIITTPFSYVATSSAIIWENCKPVFVDIEGDGWTLDPQKLEEAITPNTTCILATHVFGNPCDVENIDRIAQKHNLKVIYDAAHCFGVKYKGKSVFSYGDVSTCSFHATKIFHTGEGGASFCNDSELRKKIYYSHNFGHNGPLDFHGLGINGKISELQAAMGLAVLPHMKDIYSERKRAVEFYNAHIDFNRYTRLKIRDNTEWNYSYYPILFKTETALLDAQEMFNAKSIFPRRYFYPSLNAIPYINGQAMPVSEDIASRVLCLPLYAGIAEKELNRIVHILNQ
ncbi:MAG: DegT/DnrJ/EryC1/StrS family aminotransferase [Chitinophagales bacterium]|jgi:dTDP-4-amino-4,6-dideoxygalactose transaminase|nr:DegT/DnrJ/EryC1/StrS family aminotransferase [Sphingobacteriales bacterium]